MSHRVHVVNTHLDVPGHNPSDVDELVTIAEEDDRPILASVLRGYAKLLRQLPPTKPLSTSESSMSPIDYEKVLVGVLNDAGQLDPGSRQTTLEYVLSQFQSRVKVLKDDL